MKKAIFFVCIFHAAVSCNSKEKNIVLEEKIAKTVPRLYVPAEDPNFMKRQDTICFKNDLFTGCCFSLYPNGDTMFIRLYFNGVEEGLQQEWFPGRQIAERRFYINGRKEGLHEGWWPNRKRKFFFSAYNNEYNGPFYEWYASGLLGKAFHYYAGREEGSQRLWWDNGTVRANYVVKKGKKYGLIGIKTCVNPYDSIKTN